MLKRFFIFIAVILGIGLYTTSCAQTTEYTPNSGTANFTLQGLPSNVLVVRVNDFRPKSTSNSDLKSALKGLIMVSLSEVPSQETDNRYVLTVDVIEHRTFFTMGNWNASTRFRIRLATSEGKILGQWDARGTAQRSNTWGAATAEAVGKDSYDIAIADMMSILSGVSVR